MNRNHGEQINHRKEMYAYWLYSLPGIGSVTIGRLLARFKSPEECYRQLKKECRRQLEQEESRGQWKQEMRKEKPESEQAENGAILTQKQWEAAFHHTQNWDLEGEYDKLIRDDIQFLTLQDGAYPAHLKEIPDPPYGLFVKGKVPSDDLLSVAIIGARECSEYGQYIASELGKTLGAHGIQVISGMAKGIDGISQMAALEAGGASFGVLGCGVDICYPAGNKRLYQRLIQEGGVLSSYPPGTQPQAILFPPRNRIVSGLADVVVVVEARKKSGTLITVDMALEQGREVFCIPGRLTDRLSDGCNRLIKQGAGILLSPEDFLEDLAQLFPDRAHWGGKETDHSTAADRGAAADRSAAPGCAAAFDRGAVSDRSTAAAPGCAATVSRGAATVGSQAVSAFRGIAGNALEARILAQLDFTPQSVEQILNRLQPRPTYAQALQALMRLAMTSAVGQASPGFFVRKIP